MDLLSQCLSSPRARSALALGAGASALALFAIETYKHWPCSYHIRLFMRLFQCRFMPRRLVGLDVPIVYRGRVRLSDMDFHGHMTNSQYALDADLMGVSGARSSLRSCVRARAHATRAQPTRHTNQTLPTRSATRGSPPCS